MVISGRSAFLTAMFLALLVVAFSNSGVPWSRNLPAPSVYIMFVSTAIYIVWRLVDLLPQPAPRPNIGFHKNSVEKQIILTIRVVEEGGKAIVVASTMGGNETRIAPKQHLNCLWQS